ncbi:MAG: hypothetical protein QXE66_01800 [Desulfurococcaceae archaeon]
MSSLNYTHASEEPEYEVVTRGLRGQLVLPPESYVRFACGTPPWVELAVDVFTDVTVRHKFRSYAPDGSVGVGEYMKWLKGVRRKVVEKLLREYYGDRYPESVKVSAVLRRLSEVVDEVVREVVRRGGITPNIYVVPKFEGYKEPVSQLLVAHFLLDLAEEFLKVCSISQRGDVVNTQLEAVVKIDYMREAPKELDEVEVITSSNCIIELVTRGYREYRKLVDSRRKREYVEGRLLEDYSLVKYRLENEIKLSGSEVLTR